VYEPTLATARAAAEPSAPPVHGFPLAGLATPSEDVLQQMTALRVGIESALADRAQRSIAFVASQSGEGTTTIVQQFAATLARDERQRTVIVDANTREPSLRYDADQRVARLIRARSTSRDAGVSLNLHGWPLPDAMLEAGLFAPGAARAVVEGLYSSYDWILLDLPPALETPDAAALAAVADGAVLVMQSGRTKRPVVARSVDLLRKAGARVLGSVLNRRRLEIPGFIYKRI
jgi:Mrp family chromosome partitioning ATPase